MWIHRSGIYFNEEIQRISHIQKQVFQKSRVNVEPVTMIQHVLLTSIYPTQERVDTWGLADQHTYLRKLWIHEVLLTNKHIQEISSILTIFWQFCKKEWIHEVLLTNIHILEKLWIHEVLLTNIHIQERVDTWGLSLLNIHTYPRKGGWMDGLSNQHTSYPSL